MQRLVSRAELSTSQLHRPAAGRASCPQATRKCLVTSVVATSPWKVIAHRNTVWCLTQNSDVVSPIILKGTKFSLVGMNVGVKKMMMETLECGIRSVSSVLHPGLNHQSL